MLLLFSCLLVSSGKAGIRRWIVVLSRLFVALSWSASGSSRREMD